MSFRYTTCSVPYCPGAATTHGFCRLHGGFPLEHHMPSFLGVEDVNIEAILPGFGFIHSDLTDDMLNELVNGSPDNGDADEP